MKLLICFKSYFYSIVIFITIIAFAIIGPLNSTLNFKEKKQDVLISTSYYSELEMRLDE